MALLDVVYIHAKDPEFQQSRRKTVAEMNDYILGLAMELEFAGISCKYVSREGDRNDVTINGKSVAAIIEELGSDIRTPEMDDVCEAPQKIITGFERDPKDWNRDCVEDISDLLMKNAFSKAFADADANRIKDVL